VRKGTPLWARRWGEVRSRAVRASTRERLRAITICNCSSFSWLSGFRRCPTLNVFHFFPQALAPGGVLIAVTINTRDFERCCSPLAIARSEAAAPVPAARRTRAPARAAARCVAQRFLRFPCLAVYEKLRRVALTGACPPARRQHCRAAPRRAWRRARGDVPGARLIPPCPPKSGGPRLGCGPQITRRGLVRAIRAVCGNARGLNPAAA